MVDLVPLGFPLWQFCLKPFKVCFWTFPFLEVGALYFLHNALRAHCTLPRPRTTMGFRPRLMAGTILAASSRYLVRKKGTCSSPTLNKTPKTRSFFANSVSTSACPATSQKRTWGCHFQTRQSNNACAELTPGVAAQKARNCSINPKQALIFSKVHRVTD